MEPFTRKCLFLREWYVIYVHTEKWVEKIEAANWKNHNELKKDFLSADYVGNNRYVFNIRGNNYRLVSVVDFFAGTMVIRFIGTHNDYDRIDAKNI